MADKNDKYTHFIGIDVSSQKLDFAVMQKTGFLFHREVPNNLHAINDFIDEIAFQLGIILKRTLFCMENTGLYCNFLLEVLKSRKAPVVVEHAYHIKNSLERLRGKDDKVDAIRIAQYVYRMRDEVRLWEQRRPIIDQLSHLSTLRERLVATYKALKAPLKEQSKFLKKTDLYTDLCESSLLSLKLDMQKVEHTISKLISSDERLSRLNDIITSVPNVGNVTALQIIITTNEYRDITCPKKYACYAGVAPFKKESGLMVRKARLSPVANKKVKALLHICACGAIRSEPELRSYYLRRVNIDNKPKMATLNAIRNKLVLRVFACLKQDRLFEKRVSIAR